MVPMRAEADVVEHSLRKDRLLIVHHLFPVFFRASDPSSASASGASNQSPFGGRDEGASARSPPSRRPSDPKSSGEMAATRHPASSALTRGRAHLSRRCVEAHPASRRSPRRNRRESHAGSTNGQDAKRDGRGCEQRKIEGCEPKTRRLVDASSGHAARILLRAPSESSARGRDRSLS